MVTTLLWEKHRGGGWRQTLKEVMSGTPELMENGVHLDVEFEVSHVDLFLVTRDRKVRAGKRFLTWVCVCVGGVSTL